MRCSNSVDGGTKLPALQRDNQIQVARVMDRILKIPILLLTLVLFFSDADWDDATLS